MLPINLSPLNLSTFSSILTENIPEQENKTNSICASSNVGTHNCLKCLNVGIEKWENKNTT